MDTHTLGFAKPDVDPYFRSEDVTYDRRTSYPESLSQDHAHVAETEARSTTALGVVASAEAGAADSGEAGDGKRRKRPASRASGEKGKGLRHFSLKVCEKVESKGRTTYNEVADELVAEITGPNRLLLPQEQQQYDEKNIRRRVYDALNVLMAMDIISKEKKEIKWKGLPPSSGSQEALEADKERLLARLERKRATHQELQEQVAAIERLIRRNEANFQSGGTPPGSGVGLPFILVQTKPQATVEVEISEDMQLVHFDFNSTPFELHDNSFVLRAMGLANPPLNDVFPGPTGPMSASPCASVPQHYQLGERSVALGATNSAPQPGNGPWLQGSAPAAVSGFSPVLTRSASAGIANQGLNAQCSSPLEQPGQPGLAGCPPVPSHQMRSPGPQFSHVVGQQDMSHVPGTNPGVHPYQAGQYHGLPPTTIYNSLPDSSIAGQGGTHYPSHYGGTLSAHRVQGPHQDMHGSLQPRPHQQQQGDIAQPLVYESMPAFPEQPVQGVRQAMSAGVSQYGSQQYQQSVDPQQLVGSFGEIPLQGSLTHHTPQLNSQGPAYFTG